MANVCENCRFFVRLFMEERQGKCRRYPPKPGSERWPEVRATEWCGEWRIWSFEQQAAYREAKAALAARVGASAPAPKAASEGVTN